MEFVANIRAGHEGRGPVYSHLIYDILPDEKKVVEQPDILILEGLNVLQSGMDYPQDPHRVFVSDFVDFSIYVDADAELLRTWYIDRFLKFRSGAFGSRLLFHHYAIWPKRGDRDRQQHLAGYQTTRICREHLCRPGSGPTSSSPRGNEHAIEQIKLRK